MYTILYHLQPNVPTNVSMVLYVLSKTEEKEKGEKTTKRGYKEERKGNKIIPGSEKQNYEM